LLGTPDTERDEDGFAAANKLQSRDGGIDHQIQTVAVASGLALDLRIDVWNFAADTVASAVPKAF
jgi:hypothetical protein